jgi:hypothetical protein
MTASINAGASINTTSGASTAISRISAASSKSAALHPSANQQHVDYILVAEFSIDKGSMMEHQYPNPISGDEQ